MTRLIIGSILGNYPFTRGPRIAVWHVPSPIKLGESITATVGFASRRRQESSVSSEATPFTIGVASQSVNTIV